MNKILVLLIFSTVIIVGLPSCEKLVKGTTKKATEVTLSAIEGVVEAVDEKGGVLAEKAADATGSVAEGVGRSMERQMDNNAEKVFTVVGRTMVQSLDGTLTGLGEGLSQLKTHYNELEYTSTVPSGVTITLIGSQKAHPSAIDTYMIITQAGKYNYELQALDANGVILVSKDVEVEKLADDKSQYTLITIGLDRDESKLFAATQTIKTTVSKK